MACKYYYKGHEFQSETLLDDFLIESKRFESALGDLVFDLTKGLQPVVPILNKIQEDAKSAREKRDEWERNGKISYGPDGEMLINVPPYLGVNNFLSGFKGIDGKLLFPELRMIEYFDRQEEKWKVGDFTNKDGELNEAEINEFGLDPNNLRPIPKQRVGTNPDGTARYNYDVMAELMKNRWKVQAQTGTAIHNILLIIFEKESDAEDAKYNFEKSDKDLRQTIIDKLETKNKKFINDINLDPNKTGNVINQAIALSKQIRKELKDTLRDDNLLFFPEFNIVLDINNTNNINKLFGIIDLLVIDSTGTAHIVDYKTSIHSYSDFGKAKTLTYTYQTATYLRMLLKYGLNCDNSKLMIAPIQLTNFRKENGEYLYDGLDTTVTLTVLDKAMEADRMWQNIDSFMPNPFGVVEISGDEIITKASSWMAKCFPRYSSDRKVTKEYVIKVLKDRKKLEPDSNGIYNFETGDSDNPLITSTTETEFVEKVTQWIQDLPAKRIRLTKEMKNTLKDAIAKGLNNVNFPKPSSFRVNDKGDRDWITGTFSKYTGGAWQVVDNEVLESLGIILLKTKDVPGIPALYDIVRISTLDLGRHFRDFNEDNENLNPLLKNRKSLVGRFESDVEALSKNNNLMAMAVNGNIEIMETLAIINQLTGINNATIGNISVVNPKYADSLLMSNKQMLYCFNELNKHEQINTNKTLKFAQFYELTVLKLNQILFEGEKNNWEDLYKNFKKFKSCVPNYESTLKGQEDIELKIIALNKLRKLLEEHEFIGNYIKGKFVQLSDVQSNAIALYNYIHFAIAELRGVDFKQLLKDHSKWMEQTLLKVPKEGLSGSYIDNPGNLTSETLNLVTKLVTEAYLNVRDDMLREKVVVDKLVKELKSEANFGYVKEVTFGNQVDLYKGMFKVTDNGDLLFVNPNTLPAGSAKRKFLEYALDKINRNRIPGLTDDQYAALRDSNDYDYYKVPLALGGSDSKLSSDGLMATLKAKLEWLKPKKAWERALMKVAGLYDELYLKDDDDRIKKSEDLFKMSNMFDKGEGDHRLEVIKRMGGASNLERNLETLLLKHIFAYSVLENMDLVFPMIKASMLHIANQGAMRNVPFENDILYLEDYIKNKIHNRDIVDPKLKDFNKVASSIKQAASKLTLAFAPVQALYQPLLGLWTDIRLMITKPDGKESFTFSHFIRAAKIAFSDLFKSYKTPTLCKLLNEIYGINDMDMNTYIDRISTAKKGIWNFENMMFKFASRPDYYNRMTIFLSLMMGDGCLEAHSITSDGRLKYDWTKDKRFSKFAEAVKAGRGNSSDPEIAKQRSLYYIVASLFVAEHAKNFDGTEFKLDMNNPMDLPRAYTNKLAESMKSLGDDIYGYYSHEKKSLIMSTALGSMWLQFKTYWSGKKNQYLGPGGIKLKGDWKQYQEGDIKYYYLIDENGNILYDLPPIPDLKPNENYDGPIADTEAKKLAPVMLWEGQWLEGIIVTLSNMLKSMWDHRADNGFFGAIKEGYKEMLGEDADPRLRLVYRSNLRLLWYDLMMFALVGNILGALLGDWLKDLKDDNKDNRDFITGVQLAAANIAVMSVKNSFLDFNFIESVGSPAGLWTPFALEWGARTAKNWWNVAMGDEDFYDGVIKSSGGLKQMKPLLDTFKPDMFRTEREGGTWESRTTRINREKRENN